MATFTGQPGINNTFNGTAAADTFLFATANLNALDTVTGGGGADLLQLTTAGVLAANALAGVSGVGTIQLAAGANSITLANGNFVNVAGAKITVFGNTGNDTIDASGLTGVNAVDFRSGAGLDVLKGGAGADIFRFAAADLAGDTIQGGAGSDLLQFSTAGVLGATALAGMTGVETIGLAAGTNSITLVNGNLTGVAGTKITVFGSSGADTIDGSGLVGANAVTFNSGGGLDVLRGGAGPDVFRFAATDLASDTIQGGTGSDLLQMTTAGVLGATALSAMTGVETIGLAAGTNSVTLVDGNYTGVAGAKITVFGGSGADTINAAGLTGAKVVDFRSGGGLDVLRGGAGNDIVRFAATDLAGDTIQGGGGSDLLILSTAGVLGAAALANLSAVETIALATGTNSVTLVDGNLTGVAGAKISVYGGGGADTIDGSGLTGNNAVAFSSGGGLDVLRGGAGADTFRFAAADLNGDTISGGAGSDLLQLATAGALGATALANMTGVESIGMIAGGNSVTLVDGNFTGVAGAKITVFGNTGNDTINASGLTGVNAVDFRSGAGLDVLRGGAGADIFRFAAADLAGDTVQGGAGSDQLVFTAAGVLAANALAQMTGVETILLAPGTNGVTLVNGNFTGVAGAKITVFGGSGADTIDGSGLTGSNALDVNSGAGDDVLIGSVADDTFRFVTADLTAGDTVQGGGGYDLLTLTTAGVLAADALAGVNGIDEISLAAGGNTITLTNANLAEIADRPVGADTWQIAVKGSAGSSTIDASALAGSNGLRYTGGGGADTVLGGNGFDDFRFISSAYNPGSTIDGGDGFPDTIYFGQSMDFLGDNITGIESLINYFGGATTVAVSGENAARLTDMGGYVLDGVTQTFNVQLASGSTTDLSNLTLLNRDAGDAINVFASAAGITRVSLSASIASYTGNDAGSTVYDFGGTQTYTFGGENDVLVYSGGSTFAGDIIDGRGGADTIEFDRSMDFLGNTLTSVDNLLYTGQSDAAVTISGANAAQLTAVGGSSSDGKTQIFTIQLEVDSTTRLASLVLVNADGGDAINVVSTSGSTSVTLSGRIASFTGSAGSDTVDFVPGGGYQSGAAIDGGGGNDRITYDGNADFDGGLGDDTLVVLESQIVNLVSANFQIAAGGFVSNFENVDGSASSGSLNLAGSALSNVLIGGSAADTIRGGVGVDTLTGGGGADTFGWNTKEEDSDTITDFTTGTDKLQFKASNFQVSGPTFDRVVVDTKSANNLNSTDLFITSATFDSAVEVRDYVSLENSTASHGMFVIAPNGAGHKILYYTDDASSLSGTGFDTAFYQIADLGTGAVSAATLGDFVFI